MLGSDNGELLLVEEGDELKCGCQWLGLFLLELGKKICSLPSLCGSNAEPNRGKNDKKKIPSIHVPDSNAGEKKDLLFITIVPPHLQWKYFQQLNLKT